MKLFYFYINIDLNLEEDKEHIEKSPKRKRRKWLRRLIYLFITFFILVDVFLFFFATPVLKNYMQEKVQEKTLGLYRIDFDKISIELGSRRISLENFKLIPDTAVYNELLKTDEAKSAIYQISTSSIELWGTGFYNFFFNRNLKAKKLLIKNPLVDLKKLPSKKGKINENRDFIHEDLFLSIEKHLDQLELKNVSLENGKFHLNLNKDSIRNTTHYGFVSVNLDNFLLNKKEFEQKSKLFYADDIQVSIDDYQLKLGDGIHVLFADSIIISTKKSLLKAKTVGIKPDIELPQYLSSLKSNYYYIRTPEVEFRNFNVSNLYFNQDIEIQNIIVESPKIKLVNKLVKNKSSLKKESKEIDFYRLIKNKLKSITINTLDFKQADFKFYYDSHLLPPSYETENFNLNLFDFYLNKYAKDDESRILYSKNIRLNINKFSARIKENTHWLSTGKINLHTDTRSLHAKNIIVQPIKNNNPKPQLLNIKLSELNIKQADFYKLYHNKTFTVGKMTAGSSRANIRLFKNEHKAKNNPKRVLNDLMGKFIKQLYVRNIQLKKANFKITSFIKDSLLNKYEGKVNLDLERFFIAAEGVNKNNKLFQSEKFKIEIFNYSQFLKDHLHILRVDEAYMSNKDSLLRFSRLSIIPKIKMHHKLSAYNKSKLINLHVESSAVRGIDIQKAFGNKELIVRDISITQPSIELFNFINLNIKADSTYTFELSGDTFHTDSIPADSLIKTNTITALLSDYFEEIQLDNLTLKKGAFRFNDIDSLNRKNLIMSGYLSAALDHFFYENKTDIERFGFTDSKNLYLELNDFYRKISDNRYQLKIKKAKLSSKDSIFSADIIRFFPNSNMHDSLFSNIIWTIYSPKLVSKGINITSFLNENILDLGISRLIHPTFALIRQENKNHSLQKTVKENKKGSRFPFENIKLDSLIIESGALGILNDKFDLNNQTFHTEFNIKMSGFNIDSNFIQYPDETIEQIKATIQLQNFRYLLPQNNYFVDIDNSIMDTENKTVQIDSLNYYTQETKNGIADTEKIKLGFLNIPNIKFSGFSFVDLFNQELVSDTLIVGNPEISLSTPNTNNTKNKNPLEIDLYQKTKKIFKEIELKHTQIDDASIEIRRIKQGIPNITNYNKIHGTISNLIIDSTHKNDKEKLFNTSDIAFSLNDYELDTKNELYKIKIKELGFSTGLKKVYANLISMNPTIERDALAQKTKKEVRLVYFNANKLVATEFDFHSFLSDKKVIANKINIDDFKLHSFKNKHFPLDSILKIALPLEYMLNIKNYIKIDTVNINNSYIGVELLGPNSTDAGYFDITRLNGTITGLSNDKGLINNGLTVKMKASGLIMDKGLLTASFHFPLNSKYGEYYYGGKLNRMNMTAFNPLLENLFFVSIRDGIIDSMNFNISANEDYAEGKMKFGYDNLKFDIRNKKKTDSLIVAKRGLVSIAANSIVKDNNPRRKNGRLQEGRIYFERDIYHSVFHYWTLSTLSGIQSTMGFKSNQMKERLKLEKLTEKYNRISTKKKSKVKRKEKKKQYKEINKELLEEKKE
ncbi:MAG: hypothetical protein ABFS35_17105 [Bacteroidota bacterium]